MRSSVDASIPSSFLIESCIMPVRKRRFERPLADTLGPDDGIDPRDWKRVDASQVVRNRKALQLCRQVEHALHLALAGCGDPVLQALCVETVRPHPDSSRLLVIVSSESPGAMDRLTAAGALLRREVAAAIHRRKTPDLMFEVR